MPPQLALLICSAFVIFLLRLDRRQFPETSNALWVPTIWMLLAASKPLGLWFGDVGEDMEAGSAIDRNVQVALLLIGLVILWVRKFSWSNAIKENTWLFILIGYMLLSITWSEMPFVSFKRWIRQVVPIVMAFMLASENDPIQSFKSLLRRIIYIIIPFSLMLINYFPHFGREYGRWSGEVMWIGVSTQKNGLAQLCMVAIFFIVFTFFERRVNPTEIIIWYQKYVEVFIIGLAVYLFMGPNHTLTYSATSLAALTMGLFFLVWILWKKKRKTTAANWQIVILLSGIVVYGTITPWLGKLTIIDVSSALGREEHLTGRADIWAYLVPYANQKPIFGYGFGGFWTDEMRAATSSHAHNGYLDIILQNGFIGSILFLIFFASCCSRFSNMMKYNFFTGALGLCFIIMSTLHNIGESTLVGFTGGLSAILLFLYVLNRRIYKIIAN